jgi:hypothetical protein
MRDRSEPRSKRPAGTFLRGALTCVLPFILLALAGFPGRGQLDERVPKDIAVALDRAANYLFDHPALEQHLLQAVGFDHAQIPEAVWRDLSPLYRLEAAYLSAEAHEARSGERFLALLSRAMAQQYEGARYDPLLRPLLQQPAPAAVRFAPLTLQQIDERRPQLTPAARRTMERLAVYCETTCLGPYQVLTSYFGLTEPEARRIMLGTRTARQALVEAILLVPEAQRDPAMRRLVRDLDTISEPARRDAVFEPWRARVNDRAAPEAPFRWTNPNDPGGWSPDQGPRPPSPKGPKKGPNGDGPAKIEPKAPPKAPKVDSGVPAGQAKNAWSDFRKKEYNTFVRRHYQSAKAGAFPKIIRMAGGWGGIILGNQVKGEKADKVNSLRWRDGKDGVGEILCLVNGKEAALAQVPHELAYAAQKLVFTHKDFDPDKSAENPGVGLVGVEGQTPYFDCGPDRLVHQGRRCYFVLHPAIANLHLGWSLTLCDASFFPELRNMLVQRMGESHRDDAAALDRVFDPQRRDWETYKLIDVPLEVLVRKGSLVVQRQAASGAYPADVRESCFFSLNLLKAGPKGKDDIVWEVDSEFYPRLPALIKTSADYQNLNELIRAIAVLRWARERGASFSDPVPAPPFRPQTGSIIITREGVSRAPFATSAEALAELASKVEKRLAGLNAQGSKEVQTGARELRNASTAPWLDFFKNLNERPIETDKAAKRFEQSLKEKLRTIVASIPKPSEEITYWAKLQTLLIKFQVDAAVRGLLQPTPLALDALPGLTKIDGRLIDPPAPKKEAYRAPHKLKLEVGKLYHVDMTSDDFDVLLRIEDDKGKTLKEDDDGGGGTNARLQFTPSQSGEFTLIATSFEPNKTGSYSLYLQELTHGKTLINAEGSFAASPFVHQGLPVWSELVPEAKSGDTYRIDVGKETARSVLLVRDSAGSVIAASQVPGAQEAQVHVRALHDGPHEIILVPVSGDKDGRFKLAVQRMVPPAASAAGRRWIWIVGGLLAAALAVLVWRTLGRSANPSRA